MSKPCNGDPIYDVVGDAIVAIYKGIEANPSKFFGNLTLETVMAIHDMSEIITVESEKYVEVLQKKSAGGKKGAARRKRCKNP